MLSAVAFSLRGGKTSLYSILNSKGIIKQAYFLYSKVLKLSAQMVFKVLSINV